MIEEKINRELSVDIESGNVDWFVFGSAALILFSVIILLASYPERSSVFINELYLFVTSRVGVVYILAGTLVLGFFWLSLSKYGTVVFGDVSEPEYSEFSWISMLFCAGIGASLLYWSATEWVFYYTSPPFGLTSRSDDALFWSIGYGIFIGGQWVGHFIAYQRFPWDVHFT